MKLEAVIEKYLKMQLKCSVLTLSRGFAHEASRC